MTNPKRILIIDDNEDHRLILTYQLRKVGTFDILETPNGQAALQVISATLIDLIFLNIHMPILDGWEVIRRIRAMPSPVQDIPIVAFTAYATSSDEKKILDAGFDAYIAKPIIDLSVLQQKTMELLTLGRR